MKKMSKVRFPSVTLLAAALVGAAVAPGARATTFTWDSDGSFANGGTDGGGTWDTTTANWMGAASPDVAWSNLTADTAVFGSGGTAGTVNVSGTVNVGALTFNSGTTGNYTISGGTLNGLGTITNSAAGTTTVNSGITQPGGLGITGGSGSAIVLGGQVSVNSLALNGPQTVTLSGTTANAVGNVSFAVAGATNKSTLILAKTAGTMAVGGDITMGGYGGSGELRLGANDQIADTSTVALNAGGSYGNNAFFRLMGFNETIGWLSGSHGAGGTDVVENGGAANSILTLAGNGGSRTISGSTIQNGSGGGTLSIVKNGTGTQVFNAALNYTGSTQVNAGTLTILGTNLNSSATTVAGGTLDFQGSTANAAISGAAGQVTITGGSNSNFGGGNKTYSVNTVLSGASTSLTQTAANSLSANSIHVIGAGATLNTGNFAGSVNALAGAGTVNLAGASANLTLADGGGQTFSGLILGAGGLTKAGAGTQTLSGANTFSGTTTLSGGTLNLANALALQNSTLTGAGVTFDSSVAPNAFTLGGLSGNGNLALQNNAGSPVAIALTVGGNNANTAYGGALSAGGSLTKVGAGTLTLSGTNTYIGATTVNAGTLAVTGSTVAASAVTVNANGALGGAGTVNGAVTVNAGGGINLITDSATGTLTLGGTLTFGGTAANQNALFFDLGNGAGTVDKIAATGAVTANAANGAVVNLRQLAGTVLNAGTYTLISSAAASDTSGMVLATARAGGHVYTLTTASGTAGNVLQVGVSTAAAGPAAAFWSGATDASWATVNNWKTTVGGNVAASGAPGVGTNAAFVTTNPVAANLSTSLDRDYEINSLTFNTTATNTGIGGAYMLTLDATNANGNTAGNGIIANNTSGTNTLSAKVGLGQSQTWSVAAGGTLAVSGAVSDFGAGFGLTKTGTGALALSGANTYSGGTTLSAGTLSLGGATALGTGALTIAGGALDSSVANLVNTNNNAQNWNGDFTFAGTNSLNLGTGAVTLGANRIVTVNANTLAAGGAIGGAFSLAKAGAGTLALSGANTYTGTTTVSAGVLRIANANALGDTGAGTTVSAGAALELAGGIATAAEALALNGTGASNGGALRNASGDNTYAGAITLGSAARINADAGTTLTLNSATAITSAQALTLGGDGNIAISTNIQTGGSALTKDGNGTATLSGTGTNYTGATTVNAGTLELSGTTSYTSATTVNSGATLKVTNIANQGLNAALTLNNGATLTHNGTTNGSDFWTNSQAVTVASGAAVTLNQLSVTNTTAGNKGAFLDGGLQGGGAGAVVTINATNAGNAFLLRNANSTYAGTIVVNGAANAISNLGSGLALSGSGAALQNADIQVNGTLELGNAGIGWAASGTAGTISIGALSGTGVVTSNGLNQVLSVGNTGNGGTFAGTIANGSSTVALTKAGAGTQILTGTNTYTGATTISGGILQIGNGGGAGTLGSGAVTDTAALAFNLNNALTVSNAISGAGGTVTQAGTGTTTLSGANTYTGATTVNAGRLNVTGTLTSAVTVAGGAILSGNGSTNQLLTLGDNSLIIGGTGTGNAAPSNAFKAAGVSANPTGTVAILDGSGAAVGAHTIDVVGYTTGATPTTAPFSVANFHAGATLADDAVNKKITLTLTTATRTWNSANGAWDTMGTAAWQEGDQKFGTGDAVVFNTTGAGAGAARTVNLNTAVAPGSVTFNNDASNAYLITGTGGIIGTASLAKNGVGTATLATNNTYSGTTTIAGGTLQIGSGGTSGSLGSGAVTFTGAATLDFNRSDAVVVSNAISGANGKVTQDGTGTTTLTGANSYTGLTTVNAGTLVMTGGSAAGSHPTGGVTVNNGGTFTWNANSFATNQGFSIGAITVQTGGTFNLSNSASGTVLFNPQVLQGGGTVNQTGGGIVDFWSSGTTSDISGFSGTYNVQNGTLQIQGSTPASMATTATVNLTAVGFGASSNLDLRTQDFACDKLTGSGTVGSSFGSALRTLTVGTNGGSSTFGGTIQNAGFGGSGTMAVTKASTGTLTLTGTNTYTGATTINGGTLSVSGSGTLGAGGYGGNITDNGSLVYNTTTKQTLSGVIGGSGSLTQSGTGTLTLTGANTYGGATTISGGTLRLGGATTANTAGATVWLDASGLSGAQTVWVNAISGGAGNFSGTGTAQSGGASFNGLNVMHFNGTTDVLTNPTAGYAQETILYVGALDGTNNKRLVGGTAGNNWLMGYWGGNQDTAFDGAFVGPSGAATTSSRVYSMTRDASTLSLYKNGQLLGTKANGNLLNTISLGGSFGENSAGSLGEVLVFNTALTADQRIDLENYLQRKWFNVGTTNVLPTGTAVNITAAGAALDVNGVTQTIASLAGVAGSNVTLGNGTLTTGDATSTAFAGVISGVGGKLTKQGTGTFTLTGANIYTGATTISGGTLQLGNGGATGSLSASSAITDNGTLAFNRSDTLTQGTDFANGIGGNGGISQIGAGTTILSGANTYTGATQVNAGTLLVNGTHTASAGTYTVGTGATLPVVATLGGTGTITTTGAFTVMGNGQITGGAVGTIGTLNIAGAGIRVLGGTYLFDVNYGAASGNNYNSATGDLLNFTGATSISLSGGTFQLNAAGTPAAGSNYAIKIFQSDVAVTGAPAGQSNYAGTVSGLASYQSIVTWDGGKTYYLVPEPASFALLGLGGLLLLRRPSRRRGRAKA